ncbi:MAG: hypothetical protein ABJE47_16645 [bacterium]
MMFAALTIALACHAHIASAQLPFVRDTTARHFARSRDELPAMLRAISTLVESGLDTATRAFLVNDIRATRPHDRNGPGNRAEYMRYKRYVVTAHFRGRDVPLSFFTYWNDTGTVVVGTRSTDTMLVRAIDSTLYFARLAQLVSPSRVHLSVWTSAPSSGTQAGFAFTMKSQGAPHCGSYGSENRLHWQGDSLDIRILGVPRPGACPSRDGSGGSDMWFANKPGRYAITVDVHGDTNQVALLVTDTSVALRPVRTTFVKVDSTTRWIYPTSTLSLRCHREAGDRRLCDALHEFIQAQPDVSPFHFPSVGIAPGEPHFDEERVIDYRYANDATVQKIRRCIATIPNQVRHNSWVRLSGRLSSGPWWNDTQPGSSNSDMYAPAELLDASGDISRGCGDVGVVARGEPSPPSLSAARPVNTTHISTFQFKQTDRTEVSARSDGWIVMTPLDSWPREPSPTTHLYARAADAQRWVNRVREVISGRSMSINDGGSPRFIPSLGRGKVNANARVADSAQHGRVSFELHDCRGVAIQYSVDSAALLTIAEAVQDAIYIARSASRVATPPTLARPYEEGEVSCPAVALNAPAPPRPSDAQRIAKPLSVRFVVDTTGRVEEESIQFSTGPALAFAALVRAEVIGRRYRPAMWADVKVRQVVRMETSAFR